MTEAQVQAVNSALSLLRQARCARGLDATAALTLESQAEVILARLLAAHARETFAQALQLDVHSAQHTAPDHG